MNTPGPAPELVEHFFRHEYGKLVATLCRRTGMEHLDAVEDAVQSALMAALSRWPQAGVPNNPTAWLFAVARNQVVGELRQNDGRRRLLKRTLEPTTEPSSATPSPSASALDDDLLGMLFLCCDASIPPASQLVFALKTLCGFSTAEIAARLFTSEANVYKRFARARDKLRTLDRFDLGPSRDDVTARLPMVRTVIYLLFSEGHLAAEGDRALRLELCDEALRLATLLAAHPLGESPETAALLALMHLHRARADGRQDQASGFLLLLEEQDRQRWDQTQIARGLAWLARSAAGDRFTRFHAEAAIAAEHCMASSFEQTRWDRIAEHYALLESVAPSALHRLNRAVAVAQWKGPADGLAVLEGLQPPTWLVGSHMWSAVLADLHGRNGDHEMANRYRAAALASAPTSAVRQLLGRRFDRNERPADP